MTRMIDQDLSKRPSIDEVIKVLLAEKEIAAARLATPAVSEDIESLVPVYQNQLAAWKQELAANAPSIDELVITALDDQMKAKIQAYVDGVRGKLFHQDLKVTVITNPENGKFDIEGGGMVAHVLSQIPDAATKRVAIIQAGGKGERMGVALMDKFGAKPLVNFDDTHKLIDFALQALPQYTQVLKSQGQAGVVVLAGDVFLVAEPKIKPGIHFVTADVPKSEAVNRYGVMFNDPRGNLQVIEKPTAEQLDIYPGSVIPANTSAMIVSGPDLAAFYALMGRLEDLMRRNRWQYGLNGIKDLIAPKTVSLEDYLRSRDAEALGPKNDFYKNVYKLVGALPVLSASDSTEKNYFKDFASPEDIQIISQPGSIVQNLLQGGTEGARLAKSKLQGLGSTMKEIAEVSRNENIADLMRKQIAQKIDRYVIVGDEGFFSTERLEAGILAAFNNLEATSFEKTRVTNSQKRFPNYSFAEKVKLIVPTNLHAKASDYIKFHALQDKVTLITVANDATFEEKVTHAREESLRLNSGRKVEASITMVLNADFHYQESMLRRHLTTLTSYGKKAVVSSSFRDKQKFRKLDVDVDGYPADFTFWTRDPIVDQKSLFEAWLPRVVFDFEEKDVDVSSRALIYSGHDMRASASYSSMKADWERAQELFTGRKAPTIKYPFSPDIKSKDLPENSTVVVFEPHQDDLLISWYAFVKELLKRGNNVVVVGMLSENIQKDVDVDGRRDGENNKVFSKIRESLRDVQGVGELSYQPLRLNVETEGLYAQKDGAIFGGAAVVTANPSSQELEKVVNLLREQNQNTDKPLKAILYPSKYDDHDGHVRVSEIVEEALASAFVQGILNTNDLNIFQSPLISARMEDTNYNGIFFAGEDDQAELLALKGEYESQADRVTMKEAYLKAQLKLRPHGGNAANVLFRLLENSEKEALANRRRANLENKLAKFFNSISTQDQMPLNPDVFALYGNQDLATFETFVEYWTALATRPNQPLEVPIVLAGGRGRGTYQLFDEIQAKYGDVFTQFLQERSLDRKTINENQMIHFVLNQNGIKDEHILKEINPSTRTTENANNVAGVIREILSGKVTQKGRPDQIVVITAPFLTGRAKLNTAATFSEEINTGRAVVVAPRLYPIELSKISLQRLVDITFYVAGNLDKNEASGIRFLIEKASVLPRADFVPDDFRLNEMAKDAKEVYLALVSLLGEYGITELVSSRDDGRIILPQAEGARLAANGSLFAQINDWLSNVDIQQVGGFQTDLGRGDSRIAQGVAQDLFNKYFGLFTMDTVTGLILPSQNRLWDTTLFRYYEPDSAGNSTRDDILAVTEASLRDRTHRLALIKFLQLASRGQEGEVFRSRVRHIFGNSQIQVFAVKFDESGPILASITTEEVDLPSRDKIRTTIQLSHEDKRWLGLDLQQAYTMRDMHVEGEAGIYNTYTLDMPISIGVPLNKGIQLVRLQPSALPVGESKPKTDLSDPVFAKLKELSVLGSLGLSARGVEGADLSGLLDAVKKSDFREKLQGDLDLIKQSGIKPEDLFVDRFGKKDKLEGIALFIAFAAPDLFPQIESWSPRVTQAIQDVMKNEEVNRVITSGKLVVLGTGSEKNGLGLARVLDGKVILNPTFVASHALEGRGQGKARFSLTGLEGLGVIDSVKSYVARNLLFGGESYTTRHLGRNLIANGLSVGVQTLAPTKKDAVGGQIFILEEAPAIDVAAKTLGARLAKTTLAIIAGTPADYESAKSRLVQELVNASGETAQVIGARFAFARISSAEAFARRVTGGSNVVVRSEEISSEIATNILEVRSQFILSQEQGLTALQIILSGAELSQADIAKASLRQLQVAAARLAQTLPQTARYVLEISKGGRQVDLTFNGRVVTANEIADLFGTAYTGRDGARLSQVAGLVAGHVASGANTDVLYQVIEKSINDITNTQFANLQPENGVYTATIFLNNFKIKDQTDETILEAIKKQIVATKDRLAKQFGEKVSVRFNFVATDKRTLGLANQTGEFNRVIEIKSGPVTFAQITTALGDAILGPHMIVAPEGVVTAENLSDSEYLMNIVPTEADGIGGLVVSATALLLSKGQAQLPGVTRASTSGNIFAYKPFTVLINELLEDVKLQQTAAGTAA